MFKLLKYEHKNSRKFMSILIAVFIMAVLFLMFLLTTGREDFNISMSIYSIFLIIISIVIFIIYMISKLNNDLKLYNDDLTHSLPVNGYQILGAKLLNMILWGLIFIISITVLIIVLTAILYPSYNKDFINIIKAVLEDKNYLLVHSNTILNTINLYLSFALAMVLARSNSIKYGKIKGWLLYFIIIRIIIRILAVIIVGDSAFILRWHFAGPEGTTWYPNATGDMIDMMKQALILSSAIGTIMFVMAGKILDKTLK